MPENGRTRLTSWKEIAAYLRREVRTVIRWEKERGLPVHRVPGGRGGSVFAFTDELDKWAAGEPTAEAPPPVAASPGRGRLAVVLAAVAILAVAAVAAGLAWAWPHREMARVLVQEGSIDAYDGAGRQVWSVPAAGYHNPVPRRVSQIADLTGDTHPEAIATVSASAVRGDVAAGSLHVFDEEGRPLWKRTVDDRLTFGAGDFDPPWQPDDVLAFTTGGQPYVAWAVHHQTWWPSMMAVFDAHGSRVGTFVSAGWIRSVVATADNRHLVTAGFSNSRHGAAFAVLDARHPSGATPEEPGSPYECRNCPAGRPLRYFVVDWADIARTTSAKEREMMVSVHPGTGTIELRAVQSRNAEFIVELSPDFEVRKRWASDTFWEWHQRLEQDGTLSHPRERCPYRDGPIVREWTPSTGWKVHGVR